MLKLRGYTLIELIVFIVIVGLVTGALLQTLSYASNNTARLYYQTAALALAKERAELIIGQRQLNTMQTTSDPCFIIGATYNSTNYCTQTGYSTSYYFSLLNPMYISAQTITWTGPDNNTAATLIYYLYDAYYEY